MTPDQIKTVQDSFDRAFLVKEDLSTSFYDELFRIAPRMRDLFPTDLTEQRHKLTDTLSYTVRNLNRPEVVEETIVSLARRHAKYGARTDHFAPVGMALIAALNKTMPNGLSDEEADAWLMAYTFISDLMIEEITAYAD